MGVSEYITVNESPPNAVISMRMVTPGEMLTAPCTIIAVIFADALKINTVAGNKVTFPMITRGVALRMTVVLTMTRLVVFTSHTLPLQYAIGRGRGNVQLLLDGGADVVEIVVGVTEGDGVGVTSEYRSTMADGAPPCSAPPANNAKVGPAAAVNAERATLSVMGKDSQDEVVAS